MQADIQTTSRRESIGQKGNAGEGSGQQDRDDRNGNPLPPLSGVVMALSAQGLELIRQLEGCRLAAYPDPGSGGAPWTVGYGHTGAEVTPGLVISQAQADAWLRADVAEAEAMVDQLLAGAALSSWQREALVSFCFNVGAGALADSSLRRRLLAGEEAEVVLSAELPRWVNGAEGPLAGLVRRRQLELLHSRRGSAAIELPVPYFAQNDSSTDQGPRMCFSSTCAMAAEFLRPGCLSQGPGQADDRYLALVQRHGDTTDAQAQIQTLASLGITARLRTDGRIEDLIAQLQRRLPVPVGWLHRGPVSAPSGGGHWSLVIGWDPRRQVLLIHDPNGEADLVAGGYVSEVGGKRQLYSRRIWGRRWMVEGDGSGWWLELSL